MPKRIRLSRAKGWRLPESAVNVARPTPWGNPFRVGRDGSRTGCVELYRRVLGGSLCLGAHATIAEQRAVRRHVAAHIEELRGRDLACWCPLDDGPCHADVLLELANVRAKKGPSVKCA